MTIPVPPRIAALPFDESRQLPIPYFVARRRGQSVDFRLADPAKRANCARHNRCWICGQSMGRFKAVLIGPMCLIARTTSEPPAHVSCAEYAVKACPFLSRPAMARSPRPKPAEAVPAPGYAIEPNPGVMVLAVTRETLEPFPPAGGGMLFSLPLFWERLQFWREARTATYDEVVDSIESGLPALLDVTRQQGPAAMAEINRRIGATMTALAAFFDVKDEEARQAHEIAS